MTMNEPTCSRERQNDTGWISSSQQSEVKISSRWTASVPLLASDSSKLITDGFILITLVASFVSSGFWLRRRHRKTPKLQEEIESFHSVKTSATRDARLRKDDFLRRNSEIYGYIGTPGGYIDEWRPVELPGLQHPLQSNDNQESEIYLDYAGAALPTNTQLQAIYQDLSSQKILANPHSTGPAASRSLMGVQEAKQRVLLHLDATPGRFASLQHPPPFASPTQRHSGYEMIFTSGTTEGLRLTAERFPWKAPCSHCGHQSVFLYAQNSHTSVLGMRNLATAKGGRFICRTSHEISSMSSDDFDNLLKSSLDHDCGHCEMEDYPHLLAIPAECNFGGTRLDVQAITVSAKTANSNWFTMVDIAKAASTGPISLKHMDADFAVLSFYKLFGEPTGLGALLVKQSTAHLLQGQNHYQGGGSVDIMLPSHDVCIPRSEGLSGLVHGSLHFRGIQTLVHGFDELDRRGGMRRIHEHTTCLARELTQRLEAFRHGNGQRAIVFSGAWADPTLRDAAGPTVTFNVLRDDGSFVGYNEVSKLASLHHPSIQFRTGCFCNPGACQEALKLSDKQALENFETMGHVCGDHIDLVGGKPTGAIRISFGKDNVWEDMDMFVSFLRKTFINDVYTGKSVPENTTGPTRVEIAELFLFPIKSCAGQRVRRWKIEMPSGKLQHDREFALVDTSGTAIRLQTCPKMTTIEPSIDLQTHTMTVSAPGMDDLVIQLVGEAQVYYNGENTIKVCGNKCGGRLWGDFEVSEWFSSYLGVQCWLARFDTNGSIQLPEQLPKSNLAATTVRAGFANEQALLLISENAVSLLNGVLDEQNQRPVGSRHFRPNIVVRGISLAEHHIEDEWKVLTLTRNGMAFSTKGRCARCAMVDFDPYSGKKGKTLRALAQYRRREGQITFGVFLQATEEGDRYREDSWIEEGDEVLCR
jgi:molybdenum cofactor sulfurtransferase